MFITRVLMFYVRRKHIPGKIDIGKHRLVPRITPGMKAAAVRQLVLEKENMDLISNPYLTEEEEKMEDTSKFASIRIAEIDVQRREKMFKHVYAMEHLDALKHHKKWE